MKRTSSLLALLAAGLVTVLALAGLSTAASSAAPTLQTEPHISGSAVVGNTLTVSKGSWSSSSTIHYSYQWRRCDTQGNGCHNISGATQSTYQLQSADSGHTVRALVTAKNADGSSHSLANQTAVVKDQTTTTPTPATGCPSGSGSVDVSQLTSPAHLIIDGQTASPSTITKGDQTITLRFHVSACSGRDVQNALVLAEAIPFQQFDVPAEVQTDSSGWASVTMHQSRSFPASSKQQILAVFVRARKAGEPLLAGIAARRLVSFPVHA